MTDSLGGPFSTGRDIRLATYDDGWVSIGLLGEGDRQPREVLGPLAVDEQAALAAALLKRAASHGPPPTEALGSAPRLEVLAKAGLSLVTFERALRRVIPGDDQTVIDEPIERLRAIVSALTDRVRP